MFLCDFSVSTHNEVAMEHARYLETQAREARQSRRRRIAWHYWPDTAGLQHFAEATLGLDEKSRPDIEEHALIAWGLAQGESATGLNTSIDVLHGDGQQLKWQHNINDEDLEYIAGTPTKERPLRVYFLNTLSANKGWLPGNFDLRPRTLLILRKAGLSDLILATIFSKHYTWAKMGNQRSLYRNEEGKFASFGMCYQFRNGFNTGVSFVQHVLDAGASTYFCINYPNSAMIRLKTIVRENPLLAHRAFLIDSLVAHDSSKRWQDDIGHYRALLRGYETSYDEHLSDIKQATKQLNSLSRNWLTLEQDIQDFGAQLRFLRDSYTKWREAAGSPGALWVFDQVDTGESFDMLISQCDTCIRWTRGYYDRTNLRINLLFHLSNQRESQTNTEIAESTEKVAIQTQRDSASMITIAAVTMLFLPGTFISAILSTTFFEFGDDGLHVSTRWWILLAAAIPLTIVVFAVWLGWRRYLRDKAEARAKARSESQRIQHQQEHQD